MKESLTPGTTISHYRILSQLGAGGMGEVYLAQDTSELERTVAIKLLPAEVASNQQRMQRFVQEARTVSALMPAAIPHQFSAYCKASCFMQGLEKIN